MMFFKHLLISMAILLSFVNVVKSDIINVPDDHETIQAGIDAADQGDTVLVAPGEYVENVNFMYKAITIIGNPDDPSEVIIDGDGEESVISIESVTNGICTIAGFTIQNGYSDDGGGIDLDDVNIILRNLVIIDNHAERYGGGINLYRCDGATINNVDVINNICDHDGGGILSTSSTDVTIQNSLIDNNSTSTRGGGIYNFGTRNLIVKNSIITNNHSDTRGGGVYSDNELTLQNVLLVGNSADSDGGGLTGQANINNLINCTIVGNSAPEGSTFSNRANSRFYITNCIIWNLEDNPIQLHFRELSVAFSDIENGEDLFNGVNEEILDWGDGNINEDPIFVDQENGDYHLSNDSPCIDAGDPDADLDPDGTRSDIGAFSFFQGGVVEGFVLDLSNEQPLEGVIVTSSNGAVTLTDEAGFWEISPTRLLPFNLTASVSEYMDSTITDLEVELDDTLSVTFYLLHAELEPSVENIVAEIEIGDSARFNFSIANTGNGALEWSVETAYRGDAGLDPWELRQSYAVGEQLEQNRVYGVVYIDSLIYISCANNGNPTIYIINREGALLDTFVQPGDNNRGMKDMTYDGELIWGVVQNTVYGITLDGEVVSSFDAPYHPSTAITWDPDREILWICGTVSNPVGIDRDGNRVEGMEIAREGLRIYSLAYFAEDFDDAPLYISTKEVETNRHILYKYSFETGEKSLITQLEPPEGGNPYGSFITDAFDDFSWVFMSIADDNNGDRLDIWHLEANTTWSVINPASGTVNPNEMQEITLTINTSDLAMNEYPAEMLFTHNGFGLETAIPIDLTVTPLAINDQNDVRLPTKFAITGAYPNPFNSTIRINYSVPETSQLSIKMYDITGSLVDEVVNEIYQSGQHSITWNASNMPSGIYFARLEANEFSHTVKLMLMK